MDNSKNILVEKNGYALTVWLNRPEVHNAMNDEMIAELTTAFIGFRELNDTRFILLRGKGKSFCAGADLGYMKGIAAFGFEENKNDGKRLARLFNSIYQCPLPTIAVVHGSAFGGANGLLAACDIVIAEENTTFAFSEVKLGIIPATISPFVIKRIGEYGAKEFMLTGKRFKAKEAKKWHLVNHSVAEDELEAEINKLTKQFVSSAPNAVKQTKYMIGEVTGKNIEDVIDYTSKKIADLRASEEGQEGMASFLEKRKPKWMD